MSQRAVPAGAQMQEIGQRGGKERKFGVPQ